MNNIRDIKDDYFFIVDSLDFKNRAAEVGFTNPILSSDLSDDDIEYIASAENLSLLSIMVRKMRRIEHCMFLSLKNKFIVLSMIYSMIGI